MSSRTRSNMAERSLDEYRRFFEELRGAEHAKSELIEALLQRLSVGESELESTKMDLDREKQFNRQYQVKEAQLKAQVKDMKLESQRDPFVLLLLDGDGMLFADELVERGEAGGKDAANELWDQTRDYIRELLPELPLHFKIAARTYANYKGLGDACFRAGILRHGGIIEDFARGFTGSKVLFDYVDVGTGKDRADDKITEILKLHLNNRSCQHIIFGGSHDNGYARLLEEVPAQERSKITLLEGPPFERELRPFTSVFETTKFGSLFRETKIVIPSQSVYRSSTNDSLPDRTHNMGNGNSNNNNNNNNNNILSTSPKAAPVQPVVAGNTWAGRVTAAPDPLPAPTVSPSGTRASESEIKRNKKGERIDATLPTPAEPMERMRVAKLKMCNVHYLQNMCPFGDTCTHNHTYKPSKSEVDVLRYMNRIIPCRNGTHCDEPKCIYGHRCQRVGEGVRHCGWDKCRFGPEMHGLDTRAVRVTAV